MKKLTIILMPLILLFWNSIAQKIPKTNGLNLKQYCTDPCKYIVFNTYYFPDEYAKEWEIYNMEAAIKKSGEFIITGDLNILGKDNAIVLKFNFLFIDKHEKIIHRDNPKKFEFFNESDQADSFVFTGQIPENIMFQTETVDFEIDFYKRVPYYSISSNCFSPCKNLKLKEAIKVFKKK